LGEEWAAKAVLQERVLGHVLRTPLQGAAGCFIGGALHARDLLHRSDGSHVFLGMFNQSPYAPRMDFELSPALESRARRFRAALPRGVKLAAGLTPMPETYLVPEFDERRLARLQRLNEWLEADYLLTNLPARLPQGLFADPHHLNPNGQQRFTTRLARELSQLPVLADAAMR
jgi:hypothetical protein